MSSKTYTYHINQADPLFPTKNVTIQSINRISDLIKENRRNISNQLSFILTIFISIFIGIFIQQRNYFGIMLLADLLLGMVIFFAYKYYKRRISLAKSKTEVVRVAKNLGIPID